MEDQATAMTLEGIAAGPVPENETVRLDDLIEEDLLVEDVSIDGMCGVY